MLLGVREERRDELVAEGHRLRVYVPYGEQWYEYSVRRLQENPAMAGVIGRRVELFRVRLWIGRARFRLGIAHVDRVGTFSLCSG
jgi:hypothetical protein